MKVLLSIFAVTALLGCALVPSEPYKFYDGPVLEQSRLSVVKPQRSFGGPAVLLKQVDGKYSLDYESMRGYPEDGIKAGRLEPQAILLLPGAHQIKAMFAFTDVVNKLEAVTLLSLVGVSPISTATFQKTADIKFSTEEGKAYTIGYDWDKAKGEKGVVFFVEACSANGQSCSRVQSDISNETARLLPGSLSAEQLLAK